MSATNQHSGPLGLALKAIVQEAVAEALEQHDATRPAAPAVEDLQRFADLGLEPLRVYTAKEVARLLGTTRVASIYEIPEEELPRARRIGSGVGFLGLNVLCYVQGRPPVDLDALIDRYRDRLMQDRHPTAVRPLHENGKTRVL